MLTRDPALDTRTPRARRSVHPTLGHHFRIHSARICRILELHHTRTPLPDTPELRISTPVPCAPRLHYFTVRAPDSCSLKDEPTTNSWSGLRIRVFLLLLPLFFFFTNHNCSHPEIRILFFSKSRSIPSATTQKHPNPLSSHLTAHKSTFHFFSQSLDLHSQLTQIAIPKPDLSSKGFN